TTLDAKYRAAPLDRTGIKAKKTLVGGEWQDQPSALGQTVEPGISRPRGAGVDEHNVGRVESDARSVAMHHPNITRVSEIRRQTRRQAGVELDRGNPAAAADTT